MDPIEDLDGRPVSLAKIDTSVFGIAECPDFIHLGGREAECRIPSIRCDFEEGRTLAKWEGIGQPAIRDMGKSLRPHMVNVGGPEALVLVTKRSAEYPKKASGLGGGITEWPGGDMPGWGKAPLTLNP